jgi:hypothetical protein
VVLEKSGRADVTDLARAILVKDLYRLSGNGHVIVIAPGGSKQELRCDS